MADDVELRDLRNALRGYLSRIASDADVARWDRAERFPDEVLGGLAALGVTGLTFDERYGGVGPDYRALCVVVEELARVSGALAWVYLTTVSVAGRAVARYGSADLRARILPQIAAGDLRVSVALTEPEAGSDLGALRTTGALDSDSVVINGQKVFTTGADTAGRILTLVRTSAQARFRGALTFVLVPADADGIEVRPLDKMAGQAAHTCEVFYTDVRVPRTEIVGDVGGALDILFAALDSERVCTGAMGLGIAQGALDKARAYACERKQFGKAIVEHQAIAHLLADMVISVDSARLLIERAADKLQSGAPCGHESAVAKIAGSEAGTSCANGGMQILGGYSYMTEYGMERYWRESKLYEIAAGTNQILRDSIAKSLVGQSVRYRHCN
ncbi:hypothetical protein HH308_09360 [Gordonia sp. TBRC 11910]|uniref:Acyl-CoA dehydrogenase n=1 Tax=Gordonia asplenii TaxID=2725283 RepID=A0A848KT32_9ACTN|nr:acyl-CoA dehydrogenase family protein [Gordonia asplenii]NMO01422.1 hypothetical protein [Gordonia asplenii]